MTKSKGGKPKAPPKKKTAKVKIERTARGLYREILDAFQEIKCKNRNMVIKFLLGLSENGNQTKAALAAGFGNARNNKNITEEQMFTNAAVEANRLLKNPKIKKAYDLLCEQNDMAEIVSKITGKEQVVSLLVEHALFHYETKPAVFKNNLELAAKLKGYFTDADPNDVIDHLRKIVVQVPRNPERNISELKKLQDEGFFAEEVPMKCVNEVIEGEIVEDEGKNNG